MVQTRVAYMGVPKTQVKGMHYLCQARTTVAFRLVPNGVKENC